jgi:lipopolysaccharide assembly protein A
VLLLVFILLNLQRVEVNLYGAHTHLPLAVALLLAVVFGAMLVFAIGAARILQVRVRARRAGSSPPS